MRPRSGPRAPGARLEALRGQGDRGVFAYSALVDGQAKVGRRGGGGQEWGGEMPPHTRISRREPPQDLGRIGGIRSHLVSSKSVVIGPILDLFDLC